MFSICTAFFQISSRMFVAFSVVLSTAVIGALVYFLYRFVFYLLDVRRRGKAVDQFPGEPRHWLWGHIHLVRTFMFIFIMIQLKLSMCKVEYNL